LDDTEPQILGYQLFAYTYTGCGGSGNLVF
jgi:hypothetical protein